MTVFEFAIVVICVEGELISRRSNKGLHSSGSNFILMNRTPARWAPIVLSLGHLHPGDARGPHDAVSPHSSNQTKVASSVSQMLFFTTKDIRDAPVPKISPD
jgi:hypothetical protein